MVCQCVVYHFMLSHVSASLLAMLIHFRQFDHEDSPPSPTSFHVAMKERVSLFTNPQCSLCVDQKIYTAKVQFILICIYIYIIQSIQSCVLKNRCHFPGQPCLPPWHQVVGLRASRAARSAAAALWRWSDFDETAGGTQSAKAPQGMWNRFVPDLMLVLADTFWDLNLFPKHVLW